MITVIDYGAGNIGSVLNMIKHVGGRGGSRVRCTRRVWCY